MNRQLLLVTHNLLAGDGQGGQVLALARAALAAGWRVSAIADRVDQELDTSPGFESLPVPTGRIRGQLVKDLRFALGAKAASRRGAGDTRIVHVHGDFGIPRPDLLTVHFLHRTWMASPGHPLRQRPGLWGLYQMAYNGVHAIGETRTFRSARRIAAVSPLVASQLEGIGVEPGRIRVVPNGIAPVAAGTPAEGLPGPPGRRILFAGDLRSTVKNLATVLRAMTLLPDCALLVAGGARHSPYPELARSLGLGDRVHFLGFRHDMPAVMAACDLLLCPSWSESFSMVLVEALAAGLPVVTTGRVGAAAWLTRETGEVLDDPADPVPMAGAVRRFLGRPPARREAAAHEARRIAAGLSVGRMTQAYLGLYDELLAARESC